MSERGGQLALEHLYKYRLRLAAADLKQVTNCPPFRLDARTLLRKVGGALFVIPTHLSKPSKRH